MSCARACQLQQLMLWLLTMQDQEREASVISEKLAEEGDVDGSMVKVAEAEALQQKWKELHESYTQPDRTMSVCEICGVFVQSTDNEQRRLVRPRLIVAISHLLCEADSADQYSCLLVRCTCEQKDTGTPLPCAKQNWLIWHVLLCPAMLSILEAQRGNAVLPDMQRTLLHESATQVSPR